MIAADFPKKQDRKRLIASVPEKFPDMELQTAPDNIKEWLDALATKDDVENIKSKVAEPGPDPHGQN